MPWLFSKKSETTGEGVTTPRIHRKFLLFGIQFTIALSLLIAGITAFALTPQDGETSVSTPTDEETFEILQSTVTPKTTPSGESSQTEDAPTQQNGEQRDAKTQKVFDDMAACMAVQNARSDVMRSYADQSNAIGNQLNNLPPIDYGVNPSQEQIQALNAERDALRNSLQAQITDLYNQVTAYERSTPGGACWQGSGPVPQ